MRWRNARGRPRVIVNERDEKFLTETDFFR
jgi:hypothetical protein